MTQILTRENAMPENRDPKGIQWAIFPQQGKTLFLVYAVKKDEDGKPGPDMRYNVPTECVGEWTHSHKAQFAINQYLNRVWTESDKASEAMRSRARKPVGDEAVSATE